MVKDLGSPEHSRTPGQFEVMSKAARAGECVFCNLPENTKPPLRIGKHWLLKENDWPYKHHLCHLVIFLRRHEEDVAKLTTEERLEWWNMVEWAIHEYELPGGGLVMRFGDPEFNASTVRHLHSHIQVPDGTGLAKATFSKGPEAKAREEERLRKFRENDQ